MIPHTTNIPYIFFQYSIPWMPRCRKMMNRISILCYSHFPRFIIFGIKIATRIDPNTSNILEHWDVFQPMRDKHFRSVIHYSFQIQATIFFYEMQTCIQLQEFHHTALGRAGGGPHTRRARGPRALPNQPTNQLGIEAADRVVVRAQEE